MTFKDQHPELQHLVRELALIRNHNRKFKPDDPQDGLLLFAEGALVILVLERFLRAILVTDRDGALYNLLQQAIKQKLIVLPFDDQEDGIKRIKDVRNTLHHANYEQAAKDEG